MSDRAKWDLTSQHALEGACEWIRKRSGALMVVAIRVDDSALAVDPDLATKEVLPRLEFEMFDLAETLQKQRAAKSK